MLYYVCRVINVTAAILYPTYASYKALKSSTRNSTDPTTSTPEHSQTVELERWTRYWCIMGLVWIYQDWLEWSFAWFPFYYEFKTLLILWTVLPQIQGSTYIYEFHLSPFLSAHESTIDQFVSTLSIRLRDYGFQTLNRLVYALKQAVLGGNSTTESGGLGGTSGWFRSLIGWANDNGSQQSASFGNVNALTVAANAFLHPPTQLQRSHVNASSSSRHGRDATEKDRKLRRRQRLERELAALNSSSSRSTSDDDEGEGGGEDESEGSRWSAPPSSSGSSSSSSLSRPGPRQARDRTGQRQLRGGKVFVESRLGSSGSLYEDLGSWDTEQTLRDYPRLAPDRSRPAGGGWFGWGGGAGRPEKGKQE